MKGIIQRVIIHILTITTIGLAKKIVWVFHKLLWKKPTQTFGPTQYISPSTLEGRQ